MAVGFVTGMALGLLVLVVFLMALVLVGSRKPVKEQQVAYGYDDLKSPMSAINTPLWLVEHRESVWEDIVADWDNDDEEPTGDLGLRAQGIDIPRIGQGDQQQ